MVIANIRPETVAIFIPIVAILGTFAIVIVAIVVEGRKKDLAHKERLFALEKGLPLPELPEKKEKPVYSTRRAWGLVWLGLGLALTIGLATNPESSEVNAWAWGLIPTFIGAGLLIAAMLDKKEWEKRRQEEEEGPKAPSYSAAASPTPPAPHESGDI
jgi:hypothetical protein